MAEQPIKPPQELVEQLRSEAPNGIHDLGATRERYLIHNAYRAGADQELEACCKWLRSHDILEPAVEALRAYCRPNPKPPGLAEQWLIELGNLMSDLRLHGLGYSSDTIRAALERLKELEEKANG